MDIKLQKYMSDCGLMSRRAAEAEIEAGNVTVNGERAKLGDRVDPAKDAVAYKGKPVRKTKSRKTYLMLYKPAGYVTTLKDEQGRKTVADLVKDLPGRLYPVGRLDKDSEGLLLMTDDGEFANRIMHPSGGIRKTYIACLRGYVENNQLDHLRAMRSLEGEPIQPVDVALMDRNERVSRVKFILSEGKNRQIRRMCEESGLSVMQLKRIKIEDLSLGDLEPGAYRHLTPDEKKKLEAKTAGKPAIVKAKAKAENSKGNSYGRNQKSSTRKRGTDV